LVQTISQGIEQVEGQLRQDIAASDIYNILRPLPIVALLALLAVNSGEAALRSRVMLYLEKLADVEISIDGHDLLSLGLEAGPEVGRILREVQMARLDGEVSTREQELALANSLLRGRNDNAK
jgi:tRNA nucleotidyltransferase (CCA-adding enzyme)